MRKRQPQKKKRAAFSKERKNIVDEAEIMLKKKKNNSTTNSTSGVSKVTLQQQSTDYGNGTSNNEPDDGNYDNQDIEYDHGESNDHVEPMFAVTWMPFCSIFSTNLQVSNDSDVINELIGGMKSALKIACRCNLDQERKTLFDALIKFTLLGSTKEMRAKNIACIQTVIEATKSEGNYLGDSWENALMCFSHLARLQNYGQGTDNDLEATSPSSPRNVSNSKTNQRSMTTKRKPAGVNLTGGDGIFSYFQSSLTPEEQARAADEENASRLMKSIDMIQIDRVFLDSVYLDGEGIISMVQALCVISNIELNIENKDMHAQSHVEHRRKDKKSRTFSLQKIVEVADSNMNIRPRYVWARIWAAISQHFAAAGCHSELKITMYAVDSLRQLSVKFLEKDELAGFNFQLQFMEPFEKMMAQSNNLDLRDLLLRCIENIVLARHNFLKSGWRVVLNILTLGGDDKSIEINKLAFSILEKIVLNHIREVYTYFPELVMCLNSFASNESTDKEVSENSLKLIEEAFDDIIGIKDSSKIENELSENTASDENSNKISKITLNVSKFNLDNENNEDLNRLTTLLIVFFTLMGDLRANIRSRVISFVFNRLESCYWIVSPKLWIELYIKCFLPLFDTIKDKVPAYTLEVCERLNKESMIGVNEDLESNFDIPTPPALPIEIIEKPVKNSNPFSSTSLYIIFGHLVDITATLCRGDEVDDDDDSSFSVDSQESFKKWSKDFSETAKSRIFMEILKLLEWFILMDDVTVTNIGTNMISKFLHRVTPKFDSKEWKFVCITLRNILKDSTPIFLTSDKTKKWIGLDDNFNNANPQQCESDKIEKEKNTEKGNDAINNTNTTEGKAASISLGLEAIKKPAENSNLPFFMKSAITMCQVQLKMIEIINNVIPNNLSKLDDQEIFLILDTMSESIQFSRSFNDDLALRVEIVKRTSNSSKNSKVQESNSGLKNLSLLEQEVSALSKYLSLLFRLDKENKYEKLNLCQETIDKIHKRLETSLHKLVMHFIFQDRMVIAEIDEAYEGNSTKNNSESDASIERRYFNPVIRDSLKYILNWDIESIKTNISWLFPLLTSLLDCGNREINTALRHIFEEKISKILLDTCKK